MSLESVNQLICQQIKVRYEGTHDIFGPTQTLFSLTNSYAPAMVGPTRFNSSVASGLEAARMTRAMTKVADRETPHWQLIGNRRVQAISKMKHV